MHWHNKWVDQVVLTCVDVPFKTSTSALCHPRKFPRLINVCMDQDYSVCYYYFVLWCKTVNHLFTIETNFERYILYVSSVPAITSLLSLTASFLSSNDFFFLCVKLIFSEMLFFLMLVSVNRFPFSFSVWFLFLWIVYIIWRLIFLPLLLFA